MIKKSQISEERTLLGNKWVFKIKRDKRHRSRLVCFNYTQIPGIDFINNFSTIVYNIILRIVLSLWIIYGLDIDQIYIETVFLEKDFSENKYIYLKCSEGIDFIKNEYLEIQKRIYGII